MPKKKDSVQELGKKAEKKGGSVKDNLNIIEPSRFISWIEFVIEGQTELLQNAKSKNLLKERREDFEKEKNKILKRTKAVDPDEECKGKAHWLDEKKGLVGVPAIGFKKSFVNVGQNLLGRKMKKALEAAIFVVPTARRGLIPIKYKKYDKSIELGNLGGKKGSLVPFYRAMFSDWTLNLRVAFDENVISPEQMTEIIVKAGALSGYGAWRPENSGTYGTYSIKGIVASDTIEPFNPVIKDKNWAKVG